MSSEPRLAVDLASRMLRPSVLDEGLRSGLFIVRQQDPGHWHDFACALAAELRRLGAVVICVDAKSGDKGIEAVVQDLRAKLLAELRQVMPMAPLQPSAPCVKTLRELFKSIVDLNCNDLVLIVNHAGRLKAQPGGHLLKALKAARDAVNVPADAKGSFLLVAVDRDPSAVSELTRVADQAFLGATVIDLTIA